MARPAKLTPELQTQLVDIVARGASLETAAAYVGVSARALQRWRELGEASPSGRYGAFVAALDRALAQAELRDLLIIAKAAEKDWKAAAWRLSHKFPERWGPQRPVESRDQATPEETAARIRDALRAMRATVQGPPGPATNTEENADA